METKAIAKNKMDLYYSLKIPKEQRVNHLSLNEIITWFQNPELIIIGARPAVGKTTFMLSTASEMITNDNRNVCIFSLKSSKEIVKNCLLTIGIAAEEVIDTRLIIDDTAQITIQELCQKCRQLKSEKAIDAVFIDYLQLMVTRMKCSYIQRICCISCKVLRLFPEN